jgi:hypothetical protein
MPRLRPGEPVHCVSVHSSTTYPTADAATGPVAVAASGERVPAGLDEVPAGPGTSRVRRGGPRHGRRTTGGRGPELGSILAGAAGLVLGIGLGTAGWAAFAQAQQRPAPTEREVAVAVREARVAQLEQRLADAGAIPVPAAGTGR